MVLSMATVSWAAEKNMVFASPYGITTLDPSTSYSSSKEDLYLSGLFTR